MSNPQEVFQWHGDTFDLPPGAVHLARSRRFEHQAFRLGRRVYALQFHLECSIEALKDIEVACAPELAQLPPEDNFAQFKPRLPAALAAQQKLAYKLAERWTAMEGGSVSGALSTAMSGAGLQPPRLSRRGLGDDFVDTRPSYSRRIRRRIPGRRQSASSSRSRRTRGSTRRSPPPFARRSL